MINKISYLNNKNGFTLVEILVVIVIMGIVFTAASNLFISGYNFYIQSEEKATIQRDLRFITNYIDENAKFTHNIEVLDEIDSSNLSSNEIALGIENDYFVIKTYNGSINTRSLSDTKISTIQFERNLSNLIYTISDVNGDYVLTTKTILNNITDLDYTYSIVTGNYLIIDK